MKEKELISAYQLAERLKVSPTIIYRRIAAGDIKTETIGKTKYINYTEYKDINFAKQTGQRV